ncbi:MAG TPA: hypothetical protein VFA85_07315 [Terriglobales bacterium]|nr:hypothetical protein [Terriglobales bacterium]
MSTAALLAISFPIFAATGYLALYWAWLRGNLAAALPYLPWARNFGMFAMAAAAVALGILFSSETFPLTPKLRLLLSLFATTTIGFFSEFRNEGKFYFKSRVHFFGPSTWVHSGLNQIASSLGDFLYRMEYSHWNDFLMGPAIVSVLFLVAAMKIYRAFQTQGSVSMSPSTSDFSTELDHALQFTRIFMNVGLFWFFIQAWTEKAGYLSNPHSNDEIDLPFEFAGTMLGFWMVRVLTKPFEQRIEKFRSTFFIDFACSGVIGLLYTFVVGPLTEGIARNVAHTLHSVIPGPLELHEYTSLQQHVRPFELLLLAAAMWWGLNWSSNRDQLVVSGPYEEPQSESKWHVLITTAKVLGVAIAYLVILASTLSASEPQGIAWTVAETGIAIVVATGVLLMLKRANRRGFMSLLGMRDETSGD